MTMTSNRAASSISTQAPEQGAETRFMVCDNCGGDGGWHYPVDFNHVNGSLIEHWRECWACKGSGQVETEVEPITLDDIPHLEERPSTEGSNRSEQCE